MANILVVALSFGLTDNEPSTVNLRLRDNVYRVIEQIYSLGETPLIVSQWEIALGMDPNDITAIVPPKTDSYLSSDDVLQVAFRVARDNDVDEIVAVCQTFLHLQFVEHAITKAGFTPRRFAIDPVGFDTRSVQPWTRSRGALAWYSAKQALRRGGSPVIILPQMQRLAETPTSDWPFRPNMPAQ